jgi:hypothetical protein
MEEGVDKARKNIDSSSSSAYRKTRNTIESASNAVTHGLQAAVPPDTEIGREEVKESTADHIKAAASKVKEAFTGKK